MPCSLVVNPQSRPIANAREHALFLQPRFPPEVIDHIIVCMLQLQGGKLAFSAIAAFSLTCFQFRQIAFHRFFSLLDVTKKPGWLMMCKIPGMYAWVRVLHAPTSAIFAGVSNLQQFTRLSTVYLDFSSEGSNTHHTCARLILAKLARLQPKLPQVTRLELDFLPSITTHLLSLVAATCPALEVLILRCSNRLTADCCWTCYEEASTCTVHSPLPDVFCDADDLTRAFGSALGPLTCLRHLVLGIYLSPADFFDEHIEHGSMEHSDPFAFKDRPLPPTFCNLCQLDIYTYNETREAEEHAALGLAGWLAKLESVSWATWFVSEESWQGENAGYERDEGGEERLYVRRKPVSLNESLTVSDTSETTLWLRRNADSGTVEVRRMPWQQ